MFYTHFDVEDVANAFTITNWIPLELLPKFPVESWSNGSGDTVVVEQGGSGPGDQTRTAPEGGDKNNNNTKSTKDNKKLPGLPTPPWVDVAYHALYSTRVPVGEDVGRTPW